MILKKEECGLSLSAIVVDERCIGKHGNFYDCPFARNCNHDPKMTITIVPNVKEPKDPNKL